MDQSSPRVRGSSHHEVRRVGGRSVVPARAGVFRTLPPLSPVMTSRPRACGGLPSRGLNYVRIPAGRPRACGGLPRCPTRWAEWSGSSPRVRGSSLGWWHGRTVGDVVPARAGVFPGTSCTAPGTGGRPRACGGLPWWEVIAPAAWASSPRVRGSSERFGQALRAAGVVPARAGVFRWASGHGGPCTRRPRACGGLPRVRLAQAEIVKSSPRVRGSSCDLTPPWPGSSVVPARAGVFHLERIDDAYWDRRPRACGGLPPSARATYCGGESSPRVRGSSPAVSRVLRTLEVVPARAGVFRAGRCAQCERTRRPRACGGLPK